MKALTNPSPTATLEIDRYLLCENLEEIITKAVTLKTLADSPKDVLKTADEILVILDSVCRCLTSADAVENNLHKQERAIFKVLIDAAQKQSRDTLELLKKCVANS